MECHIVFFHGSTSFSFFFPKLPLVVSASICVLTPRGCEKKTTKTPRFAAVSDPALIDIHSKDVFGTHGTFGKYFVFSWQCYIMFFIAGVDEAWRSRHSTSIRPVKFVDFLVLHIVFGMSLNFLLWLDLAFGYCSWILFLVWNSVMRTRP